jgi:hypothetical protein
VSPCGERWKQKTISTYHHTCRADEEEAATTCRVHERGGSDRSDQGDGCLPNIKSKLLASAGNASSSIDEVGVVGEKSVARVLRNDTKADEDSQPPSIASSLEELEVARACLGFLLQTHSLTDLSVLELYGSVVGVSSCMVVREEVEGLVVAVLADEISG